MQIRSARYLALQLAVLLVLGLCFVDAGAQKRRKRTRRVIHPATAAPSPTPESDASTSSTDPRIVSTADQLTTTATPAGAGGKKRSTSAKPAPAPESEQEALRHTISDLSGQVNKLTDKLNKMEDQQRSLVDIERLSRLEQRAEGFRSQLRDVQARETDLQGQLEQVDYALIPENIERAVAGYGTTHPEVARDQRRRQLETQKARLRTQLDQLGQSRVRLEPAIATADAEVDKLRQQMDLETQQLDQPARPAAQPSPTPAAASPPGSPERL